MFHIILLNCYNNVHIYYFDSKLPIQYIWMKYFSETEVLIPPCNQSKNALKYVIHCCQIRNSQKCFSRRGKNCVSFNPKWFLDAIFTPFIYVCFRIEAGTLAILTYFFSQGGAKKSTKYKMRSKEIYGWIRISVSIHLSTI